MSGSVFPQSRGGFLPSFASFGARQTLPPVFFAPTPSASRSVSSTASRTFAPPRPSLPSFTPNFAAATPASGFPDLALMMLLSGGLFGSPTPAATRTASQPVARPTTAAAPSTSASRPLKVAVIDQFQPDSTGFNHGESITNTIAAGGSDSRLSGRVSTLKYDVAGNNSTGRIADALKDVAERVKRGEVIDAVNVSQQDFSDNFQTQRVRQAVQELISLGVPVAIAAGNGGPNMVNQLTTGDAFIVSSAQNGQINADSGRGNVVSEGRSTSFATANLTPTLASLKASGLSISQIHAQV